MKVLQQTFTITIVLGLIFSCKAKESSYMRVTGNAQGTTYNITYKSENKTDYSSEIDLILLQFDLSLSIYKPNSIISKINNNIEGVIIDSYFKEVFNKSQQVAGESDGAFDITVGPLTSAWGFGLKEKGKVTPEQIDSLLKLVGYTKVQLLGNTVNKSSAEIKLDVNAIAQGYSVDVVCDFLKSKEITDFLVEIGGEVRTQGLNPKGEAWKIGIDKPIDGSTETTRELQSIVALNNMALATSGNYRKFYVQNNIKYSHTINPKTGYPVSHNLLSATIIAADCMSADAYATVCMVLGPEAGMDFVKKTKNIEAYFIVADSANADNYQIISSSGFSKYLIKTE